jgi:ABC-2 type transport system permease protein
MRWSVFRETLRRELRPTLFWGAAIAGLGFITTAVLPDQAGMQDMVTALEAMPPFFFQMLGIEDLSVLASPAGFIAFRFFLTASVLLAVWAVLSGMNVIMNDEARGIANMVVALPLPRWQLVVEKVLAYVPLAVLIPMFGVGGLALGIASNPNAQTDLTPLVLAGLAMAPVALVVLALTVLAGAAIPRRAFVGGIAGGFVAVSFMLKSVANLARSDAGDALAQLSVFEHADAVAIISDGFPVLNALVLLAIAAGLIFAAVRLFERRDLAA